MVLKIPSKIKIGPLMWEVVLNDDVANEGNCFGSTHYRSQKIFIENSSTEQKKALTLLHEILHVVVWTTGLSHRFTDKDVIPEEHIVTAMADSLMTVLKENELRFDDR